MYSKVEKEDQTVVKKKFTASQFKQTIQHSYLVFETSHWLKCLLCDYAVCIVQILHKQWQQHSSDLVDMVVALLCFNHNDWPWVTVVSFSYTTSQHPTNNQNLAPQGQLSYENPEFF